jgi:hypothetical protein
VPAHAERETAAVPIVDGRVVERLTAAARASAAVLIAIVARRVGVVRQAGRAVEVLQTGNATANERTERTLPPGWWMGGSHCWGDV